MHTYIVDGTEKNKYSKINFVLYKSSYIPLLEDFFMPV